MTNEEKFLSRLASLFAIQFTLDPYNEFLDIDNIVDREIEYDCVAEDCKFYMNLELIKLLNEGYTEDEVLEMIDGMTVEGMDELPLKKKNYVRDETKKLVMKRKERLNYE